MHAPIDNGGSKTVLGTSKGGKTYHLMQESRMFKDFPIETEATIEVNDRIEVIDIHGDRKSSKQAPSDEKQVP